MIKKSYRLLALPGPAVVETIRVVEQATDASTDPSQSPLPALRGADAAPEPADGTESAAEGRHLGGQRGEQDELWLPPDIAEEPPGLCPQNVQVSRAGPYSLLRSLRLCNCHMPHLLGGMFLMSVV